MIEEARHDAEKIAEQLRAQADAELERIKVQGGQQVRLLRQQLIRELRQSLGAESVHRAGELVRDFVSDPAEQSATVDRFLDELDEMAPSSAVFEDAVTAKLRAASRESVAKVVEQLDEVTADLDADRIDELGRRSGIGGEAAAPGDACWPGIWPTRPATQPPRCNWWRRLLSGKVSDAALEILKTAVSQRWSSTSDLIHGIQHVARLALLVRAEREGQIEDVEDQLFRFSRILDSEPRLITLLSDYTHAARRPNQLAEQRACSQGEQEHRRSAAPDDRTVARRARRRGRPRIGESRGVPARRGRRARRRRQPSSATPRRDRLTEVLTRIYGHPVSLQLDVNPDAAGRPDDRRR